MSGPPARWPETDGGTSITAARLCAFLTWIYTAGFGIPAIPVAVYVHRRDMLPWFGGLFPMYGACCSLPRPGLLDDATVARIIRVHQD